MGYHLSDTDKHADTKASETITAVEAALTAAGFDAPKSKHNTEAINVKTADGKYIASVRVRRDSHDYRTVVKATVSPDWTGHRARIKTANFWAGREKDFTIDPAKIVAKVLAIAAAMAEHDKHAAAMRAESTAHAKRLSAASAEMRALTERPPTAGAYGEYFNAPYKRHLNTWNIREASDGVGGYTYSFDADLRGLSEETLLKVLALIDKS